MAIIIVLFHLILNLTNLIKLLWLEHPILFLILTKLIINNISALLILASFSLGRNGQDIIKCKNNRIIIIIISILFDLLGQQISILFNHLIYHVFYHTNVHGNVRFCKALRFTQFDEFTGMFVIHEREYFFDVHLD